MKYETVIGLEVHVQLKTQTKIFCSCSTEFGRPANENTCPICLGMPGVLPVLNKKAVEYAMRTCLATHCKINPNNTFDRKNYFYPDLPKGYQISQYKFPLGENGFIFLPEDETRLMRKIGITRVHLEEDAGKLIHKENYSLVDFNRTGIPLLEIVSEPDIDSPSEAFIYLTYLKLTLQYIGVSSCDMEKGFLRCDANISLRRKGEAELGTKVELKNMNSFRGVRDALSYEAKRQADCLENGKDIFQETRLWDESKRKTFIMRTKEEAHDYRYFPEPDLGDFSIDEEMINKERNSVGELPVDKRNRFLKMYSLKNEEVDVIISDIFLANFFEDAVKIFPQPKSIINWLLGPFLELANSGNKGFAGIKITPRNFSKLVEYFREGKQIGRAHV